MAPNSLSPSSVVISYTTLYGAHKMTIPTTQWFVTSITGNLGSYAAHDTTPVDAETMVRDLLAKLKVFALATTEFAEVTAYTQATPTAPNIPRATVPLGIVGTSGSSDPSQAVSYTFNFKTSLNGDAKLVLLDAPIGSTWFRSLLPASFDAGVLALETEFCLSSNAWTGRDDGQPSVLRKVSFDLNDKLQKAYRMT